MKRDGRRQCSLCSGELSWRDSRTGKMSPGCNTHQHDEPALCLKYKFLRRKLDPDDLKRALRDRWTVLSLAPGHFQI
jgi:hypothetical protein